MMIWWAKMTLLEKLSFLFGKWTSLLVLRNSETFSQLQSHPRNLHLKQEACQLHQMKKRRNLQPMLEGFNIVFNLTLHQTKFFLNVIQAKVQPNVTKIKVSNNSNFLQNLKKHDMMGQSDPYVLVSIPGTNVKQAKTKQIKNNANPVWNETFSYDVSYQKRSIHFKYWFFRWEMWQTK